MIANTLILKSGESKRNASWKDGDQGRIGRPSVCPNRKALAWQNKPERQMPLRLPDLMIVLTGDGMSYTLDDGVKVIPWRVSEKD